MSDVGYIDGLFLLIPNDVINCTYANFRQVWLSQGASIVQSLYLEYSQRIYGSLFHDISITSQYADEYHQYMQGLYGLVITRFLPAPSQPDSNDQSSLCHKIWCIYILYTLYCTQQPPVNHPMALIDLPITIWYELKQLYTFFSRNQENITPLQPYNTIISTVYTVCPDFTTCVDYLIFKNAFSFVTTLSITTHPCILPESTYSRDTLFPLNISQKIQHNNTVFFVQDEKVDFTALCINNIDTTINTNQEGSDGTTDIDINYPKNYINSYMNNYMENTSNYMENAPNLVNNMFNYMENNTPNFTQSTPNYNNIINSAYTNSINPIDITNNHIYSNSDNHAYMNSNTSVYTDVNNPTFSTSHIYNPIYMDNNHIDMSDNSTYMNNNLTYIENHISNNTAKINTTYIDNNNPSYIDNNNPSYIDNNNPSYIDNYNHSYIGDNNAYINTNVYNTNINDNQPYFNCQPVFPPTAPPCNKKEEFSNARLHENGLSIEQSDQYEEYQQQQQQQQKYHQQQQQQQQHMRVSPYIYQRFSRFIKRFLYHHYKLSARPYRRRRNYYYGQVSTNCQAFANELSVRILSSLCSPSSILSQIPSSSSSSSSSDTIKQDITSTIPTYFISPRSLLSPQTILSSRSFQLLRDSLSQAMTPISQNYFEQNSNADTPLSEGISSTTSHSICHMPSQITSNIQYPNQIGLQSNFQGQSEQPMHDHEDEQQSGDTKSEHTTVFHGVIRVYDFLSSNTDHFSNNITIPCFSMLRCTTPSLAYNDQIGGFSDPLLPVHAIKKRGSSLLSSILPTASSSVIKATTALLQKKEKKKFHQTVIPEHSNIYSQMIIIPGICNISPPSASYHNIYDEFLIYRYSSLQHLYMPISPALSPLSNYSALSPLASTSPSTIPNVSYSTSHNITTKKKEKKKIYSEK